jgi:hypothetical protein
MMKIKNLKGECQHCGGAIEFRAETAGMTADCPHCGQATELLLATPPQESAVPRKALVFTGLTLLILVGGLAGALIILKRAQDIAARNSPVPAAAAPVLPDPFAQAGFRVSPVTLEKAPGSALVYAVGTIHNRTNRQRFGVRVGLELLDDLGRKLGVATDYQRVIEPNDEWRFRAQILEQKTASARLVSIKEDQ